MNICFEVEVLVGCYDGCRFDTDRDKALLVLLAPLWSMLGVRGRLDTLIPRGVGAWAVASDYAWIVAILINFLSF